MKLTKLSALVVAGGLCFLPGAAFSADAEVATDPAQAPTGENEKAGETMTLSVVVAKGGG